MLMDPGNILMLLKQIVTGGGKLASGEPHNDAGFLVDKSVSPSAMATTGTRATAENGVPADVIVLDLAAEDAIVNFTVPRDYDELTDTLKVSFLVAHVSGTSVAVNVSAVSKGSPTSVVAALTGFVAGASTVIDAAFSIGEITVDLSDLGLVRNDNVNVNLAAGAVVSLGVIHVLGSRIEHRSCLVSYNETSGSAAALADLR